MLKRYDWGNTTFLGNLNDKSLYQSKRNKNGFKSSFNFINKKDSKNNNQGPFTGTHQNSHDSIHQENSKRGASLTMIKKKITHFLQHNPMAQNMPMPMDGKAGQNKKQRPKNNIFRVTLYRNHLIRQKINETSTQQQLIDIKNQLRVNEIYLANRNSIPNTNSDKPNHLYSYKRDVLRFHGESKCFQKIAKQKLQQNQNKQDVQIMINNRSQARSKDFSNGSSLQYSKNDEHELLPWKRGHRDNDQIELSMMQSQTR